MISKEFYGTPGSTPGGGFGVFKTLLHQQRLGRRRRSPVVGPAGPPVRAMGNPLGHAGQRTIPLGNCTRPGAVTVPARRTFTEREGNYLPTLPQWDAVASDLDEGTATPWTLDHTILASLSLLLSLLDDGRLGGSSFSKY